MSRDVIRKLEIRIYFREDLGVWTWFWSVFYGEKEQFRGEADNSMQALSQAMNSFILLAGDT